MRIAIHAADLDHKRIDGTRVYIFNMLKNFGAIDSENSFCVYHQSDFNPHLAPPEFENYIIKKLPCPRFWTQLRFAWQLFKDKPDVLWMPVHNMPILRRKEMQVVVTIHDLAFKIFPQYFPKGDLKKLNRLSDYAIKHADHLIAVSESTKNDILKFYPEIKAEKVSVIHHGFDRELFEEQIAEDKERKLLEKFGLQSENYLLYVGAIQPRKNLETLISAFEKIKATRSGLKLVLAGERAWQFQPILDQIEESPFEEDIIITGTIPFDDLPALYQNAAVFVFPSLYEGFGIPVLEAMASGTPTILAKNSSLIEVGADAALFFETQNVDDLAEKIENVLSDDELKENLFQKGKQRCEIFSWKECAEKTLECLIKK